MAKQFVHYRRGARENRSASLALWLSARLTSRSHTSFKFYSIPGNKVSESKFASCLSNHLQFAVLSVFKTELSVFKVVSFFLGYPVHCSKR